MDVMSDKVIEADLHQGEEDAIAIARVLDDAKADSTVVLDVRDTCGFADFMVIATALSQGHLRGLIVQLDTLFVERGIEPLHPRRRDSEFGWVLVDLGFVVVHLMSKELREFYELERLWFGATTIFPEG